MTRAPRKLKEDVSNKFPLLLLEKKQTKNKFKSPYEREPQIAISGTKHTILTNENKTIHRKRASKPINPLFKNLFSRRGKHEGNRRKIHPDRTKRHRTHRKMQYTNTGRKCTGQNTGYGKHNN